MQYISETEVLSLLDWDKLYAVIEMALADVSSKSSSPETLVVQPARGIMVISHKNGALLTMPGLSGRENILACKLVTSFLDNPGKHNLPSILANIMLMDPETGELKGVVAGTAITEWRTACASVVATKHLWPSTSQREVLAVLGAGKQGRIHIIAFQHFFKFREVRLWNRTPKNAEKLANELRDKFQIEVKIFPTVKDCTKIADVIVTATYAVEPILTYEDIKPSVMINAIGAGRTHHSELHRNIYEKGAIYTDSMANADVELKGLKDEGFTIIAEVGEVINKSVRPKSEGVVIFHSLGMAVEDAVAAKMVWDSFVKKSEVG